jgi:oligopeptide/dipeptide ABC transporter ATP-binding protein
VCYRKRGPLLQLSSRRKVSRQLEAVAGIDLAVARGEMLALVGESGSGKTSTAQAALRLVDVAGGQVIFDNRDITTATARALRPLRAQMQVIYQDPYEALDPRFRVKTILEQPLVIQHPRLARAERRARSCAALETVGLRPAEAFLSRFPRELSGGQRQRVAIASSLILDPSLIVADEPVSMLDVSVRAEIMALLAGLRRRGIGILLITHDLATASNFADRIAVMYLGRIVEEGPIRSVIDSPQHPYTKALLSVVPRLDPRHPTGAQLLRGEIPDPSLVPTGCRFHPRCPLADSACRQLDPQLHVSASDERHRVACLHA